MPRPKPNRASASFMLRGHRLADEAATELMQLLGYENVDPLTESIRHQFPNAKIVERKPGAPIRLIHLPEVNPTSGEQVERSVPTDVGRIIREIEAALGVYLDGQQHLDNTPRPTHYVAAFKGARADALRLYERLTGWTEFFRDQVRIKGSDVAEFEAALASLLDVSNAVIKDFEGRSSKGARRNTALIETIRRLRHIFRGRYKGPSTGRVQQGAFQYRSEEESRELRFVQLALVEARIIAKGYSGLPRLFLDPRCAMPQERAATIERIAAKGHPAGDDVSSPTAVPDGDHAGRQERDT